MEKFNELLHEFEKEIKQLQIEENKFINDFYLIYENKNVKKISNSVFYNTINVIL
ncbi:hypothetical protein CWI39_2774p0010 [Hamiltosporidium magnivora]|uniref:Uncharacterized protein n=1 Tax=Hamiltosporidium magnivora TaxID=148818 RepID=A0A4Q9KU25_9MICR|nr:hypothetical protein CWI39_2774p0010 [Hamiltosporidium magnivora]